ncbi:MAG: 2-C-methyl-D-erythritol 4-phosphate cytidylyltransferase [Chloroflexi bacterium]|nr:2-C-methyl-D-erythritol 4-phosphate cytidylyltransferase [Chloroflexota bacterium]
MVALPHIGAVIVAAGSSARMRGTDKLRADLSGLPLLQWSVQAADACSKVERIVLVVHADRLQWCEELVRQIPVHKPVDIVLGGSLRQDSVSLGCAILAGCEYVAVHDGARPFATAALWDRCITAALAVGTCAIAAFPVHDTLKMVSDQHVERTIPRESLWMAQTPQVAHRETLLAGLTSLRQEGRLVTDEASVFEYLGLAVQIVDGEPHNFKVTAPDDLELARALTQSDTIRHPWTSSSERASRPASAHDPHVGIGYDIHRLIPGRPLVLGGVRFQHPSGLEGHSDADVVLHAIMDAVLGAAALGDIGAHFPPQDERYRNADSRMLLRQVCAIVSVAGFSVQGVDVVVVAEQPRLRPSIDRMRHNIAGDLHCDVQAVSVKATTNERLGPEGREEGISAIAIASLALQENP